MYGLKKLGAELISIIILFLIFPLAILTALSWLGFILIGILIVGLVTTIFAYLWSKRRQLTRWINALDTFASMQPKQENENISQDATEFQETSKANHEI